MVTVVRTFKQIANVGVDDVLSRDDYSARLEHSLKLEEKLKSLSTFAEGGGGEKAIERHVKKNKKILVRERVELLLDKNEDGGTDFMELSLLAGLELYGTNVQSAGTASESDVSSVENSGCARDQFRQVAFTGVASSHRDVQFIRSPWNVPGVPDGS